MPSVKEKIADHLANPRLRALTLFSLASQARNT